MNQICVKMTNLLVKNLLKFYHNFSKWMVCLPEAALDFLDQLPPKIYLVQIYLYALQLVFGLLV